MDLFDLSDWLSDCADDCKKEIEREVEKEAKVVQAQAKLLVPSKTEFSTGNLRNNINTSVKWEGNTCVGVISANTNYAIYVEYGTGIYAPNGNGRPIPWVYTPDNGEHFYWTRGQHPQPFMNPALENAKDKIFRDLTEMVGRLLK